MHVPLSAPAPQSRSNLAHTPARQFHSPIVFSLRLEWPPLARSLKLPRPCDLWPLTKRLTPRPAFFILGVVFHLVSVRIHSSRLCTIVEIERETSSFGFPWVLYPASVRLSLCLSRSPKGKENSIATATSLGQTNKTKKVQARSSVVHAWERKREKRTPGSPCMNPNQRRPAVNNRLE
ncbi:hypothetical protein LZ30DRAFT_304605 [Colletotrichum cereale]|nr:hypothetical protein LZ30DRAFT_304605 [Colletotrichum cereale]